MTKILIQFPRKGPKNLLSKQASGQFGWSLDVLRSIGQEIQESTVCDNGGNNYNQSNQIMAHTAFFKSIRKPTTDKRQNSRAMLAPNDHSRQRCSRQANKILKCYAPECRTARCPGGKGAAYVGFILPVHTSLLDCSQAQTRSTVKCATPGSCLWRFMAS